MVPQKKKMIESLVNYFETNGWKFLFLVLVLGVTRDLILPTIITSRTEVAKKKKKLSAVPHVYGDLSLIHI